MKEFISLAKISVLLIICICFLFFPDNAFADTENRIAEPDVKKYTGDISKKYPSLDNSLELTSYRTITGFSNMVPVIVL